MQRLSNKLKAELYKELGFQFKSKESSYADILEAVNLGEKFKDVCDGLDLEATVVDEYIKKYVLHLILEEAATLSQQEVDLTISFPDEPLLGTTIGESLEDMQNEVQYVLSERFQSYLHENLKVEIVHDDNEESCLERQKIDNAAELFKNFTYPFTERTHTLFPFYFKKYVNKQRSVKPRIDKDFDNESLPNDLLTHYHQFIELLNDHGNGFNPTRDILEIERETDVFFLLKAWSLLPSDYFNKFKLKKDKNNYLKVLASFSLIEDFRLKLYFTEQFIKEDNSFPFIKGQGYSELFILIFLYVPLLKEYLIENIRAPKGELSIKSDEVTEKEEVSRLREIKKKLFLYHTIKGVAGYKLADLRDESIYHIDESRINYSEDFIEFYKKVKKVNGIRRQFSEEAINDLFETIRVKPDLVEAYFYYIASEFATNGEKLALRLEKNLGIEEVLQVFSSLEVDPGLMKDKFLSVNIDLDNYFFEKK
ncbi:hypothetical protein FZD47_12895 [Bacillus infantis]|uniref:Uncharacterized protein n=1 Tax=Bacillus infantis TaxID=324767 RepID=A0A5D4SR81_9BACI|nr:hypothetical protein [Bacillus infantis]TYS64356.1 hypothetical protein FZD47_12895 [Bacillus infantis]